MKTDATNPYLDATHRVPAGETRTFAELAALAGRPGAARAAGRAIAACKTDAPHPWHRIVASDGSLAAGAGRARIQRQRLIAEGALRPDEKKVARAPRRSAEPPPTRKKPARRAAPRKPTSRTAEQRLASLDWARAVEALRSEGVFVANGFLEPRECEELQATFAEDALFERTIQMGPRGYGVGTYRYFREPVPEPLASVRAGIYVRLRDLAAEAPGACAYPPRLEDFWRDCRASGQERASSILLRYPEGGVNFPHRDVYGRTWFPYQAVCVLSKRGVDFEGGEFVLHEEESGGSSRERAFALDAGDLLIFASKGYTSSKAGRARFVDVRHGMRAVTRGERFASGLVLHLAE
ncbi:MAG TPA: 2OG-Fe(II) oxygenase [Planctomycetota bacterium]|jgi:hypothetical protein|nr:2OG-Fe(II) oxygenase [Planctomycetota bacterium]